MKFTRRWKIFSALLLVGVMFAVIFIWSMGNMLVASANQSIGNPPAGLKVENVEFPSASGATIHGWFVAGEPGKGVVMLMHGVRGNRMSQVRRAEFLSHAGYAVLLFDFQAHGESLGKRITFGFLESRDAAAAIDFLHQKLPGEKIGVIGVSLGAASALLANPPLPVSAMILESSFPTLYQAAEDRMIIRFGWLGKLATPLLTCQLQPRLGISLADLQPIESARKISAPKFFIAGTTDRDTTIAESRSLFAAAAEPKQCWWIEGAAHVDMQDFAGSEYEQRVLAFLADHLK